MPKPPIADKLVQELVHMSFLVQCCVRDRTPKLISAFESSELIKKERYAISCVDL